MLWYKLIPGKHRTLVAVAVWLTVAVLNTASVAAKLNVVTSTTDLASIAGFIGGPNVKVTALCRGKANPHFVEVLPSYMVKVARADVYLQTGLRLDQWSQQVIDGSRNGKLLIVDCSHDVEVLERIEGTVDASQGHVHPEGNPHYWLDPRNVRVVAGTVASAFVEADPANRVHYESRLEAFGERLDRQWLQWRERARPLAGTKIITYHKTFSYLANAFDFEVAGYIEPLPGIEPTPSHTRQLIDLVKREGIKVIGVEPYYSLRAPEAVGSQTGCTVVVLPTSVGGADGADDYFALIDVILKQLLDAHV